MSLTFLKKETGKVSQRPMAAEESWSSPCSTFCPGVGRIQGTGMQIWQKNSTWVDRLLYWVQKVCYTVAFWGNPTPTCSIPGLHCLFKLVSCVSAYLGLGTSFFLQRDVKEEQENKKNLFIEEHSASLRRTKIWIRGNIFLLCVGGFLSTTQKSQNHCYNCIVPAYWASSQ